MASMESPAGTSAAKASLVHCIVDEAQREGVPLTGVERDMLYFSETDWTLPNMPSINEAFDRDYDQQAYEAKIVALIRNFKARAAKEDRAALELWKSSVDALQSEDHYILVMIGIAEGRLEPSAASRAGESTPMLKLIAIGIGAGIVAIAVLALVLLIARR